MNTSQLLNPIFRIYSLISKRMDVKHLIFIRYLDFARVIIVESDKDMQEACLNF